MIEVELDWKDSGYIYFEAGTGNQFIRVKLEVTNVGQPGTEILVEEDQFAVRGGGIYPYSIGANGNPFLYGPSHNPFNTKLEASESTIGNFITEIPDDATDLRIEYNPRGFDATYSQDVLYLSLTLTPSPTPTPRVYCDVTPFPTLDVPTTGDWIKASNGLQIRVNKVEQNDGILHIQVELTNPDQDIAIGLRESDFKVTGTGIDPSQNEQSSLFGYLTRCTSVRHELVVRVPDNSSNLSLQYSPTDSGGVNILLDSGEATIISPPTDTPTPVPTDTPMPTVTPTPTPIRVVSSGVSHTCALSTDGYPACWGDNIDRKASPPYQRFIAISSGENHTCALRSDGSPMCWGNDEYGQSTPPDNEQFSAISSGKNHTCGLRYDSSVSCWGHNRYGQSSPPVNEQFVAISSGRRHTCGLLQDGISICWGKGKEASPPIEEKFSMISSGDYYTCALRLDGSPVCWGNDGSGQASPPSDERFTTISSGGEHTCGLREDGSAVCWGKDDDRQASPKPAFKFAMISNGTNHSCAFRTNHSFVCWGNDEYGQASPTLSKTGHILPNTPSPTPTSARSIRPQVPSAIASFGARDETRGTVKWEAVPGADYYKVHRCVSESSSGACDPNTSRIIDNIKKTEYKFSRNRVGWFYSFAVASCNRYGCSKFAWASWE